MSRVTWSRKAEFKNSDETNLNVRVFEKKKP